MDEQWGYVGAKSRQRWLLYAYDRLRKTVVAHVFGERTMATLGRLMSLLSPFDVVIWMTDGWPLYESRLKGKLHVISKRYTQRIERHNLNLRQHLARLGRLMSLLSPFDVVIWMTDGWPLYESRLKGKLHVISKRYTQRIERHNLNLRQHLARLGRKSLSFSKSVELHDKVIGHYLNIKHYQ
ncbi:transposase [Escherichia coli]|nr:transposase [Escherichia coli]